MHSYLKAIGFSNLNSEADAEKLLNEVFHDYTDREIAKNKDKSIFMQMKKEYAPKMGIMLCGDLDGNGFHKQYYFPYFEGSGVTTAEEIMVEKRVNGDSYAGVCEDSRVGVSIIFYLQNAAEFEREQLGYGAFHRKQSTTLCGLSTGGMILLPLQKDHEQIDLQRKSTVKRRQLLNAARNGDEEAIEDLTLEDMGLYSMISRRIYEEDLYSIVDTFFMPYGIECDEYQIMGIIQHCKKVRNRSTNEYVYQLNLECNDICFNVCINQSDLLGEPEAGRRFKGTIWLQGKVNF